MAIVKPWSAQINEVTRTAGREGETRFYYSGMAQAVLLDRLLPGWKERAFEPGERLRGHKSRIGIMTAEIFFANTDEEIESCFPVFNALRPNIRREEFLPQVRRQQSQSYQILALRHEGIVKSAAGFRFAEFLAWGKVLYIDDLSTLPEARSQGYADSLLNWLIEHAKSRGCQGIHLDSGYTRYAAHRLYLRKGLQLNCHHLALEFKGDA